MVLFDEYECAEGGEEEGAEEGLNERLRDFPRFRDSCFVLEEGGDGQERGEGGKGDTCVWAVLPVDVVAQGEGGDVCDQERQE